MDPEDREFFEARFRSVTAEMRRGFAAIHQQFAKFRSQMAQMNNRGGVRAIAEWSERTDASTAELLQRAADIDQRRQQLENKKD